MLSETQNLCECLSVIIPVHNEEATLARVVQALLVIPHLLEIIIVDDGSFDQTASVAKNLAAVSARIVYTRHAKNAGKTAALKTGLALTRGES
jgi:glycosyltransferase involved in cell wall biosynthesis